MKHIALRFSQIFDKLIFCIRVAAGPRTLFRLLANSKRLDHYQKKMKLQITPPQNEEAVAYSVRHSEMSGKKTARDRDISLYLRTFSGDIRIFYEVFWELIYRLPESILRNPLVIVDAGANIGMTGLYFSIVYPGAQIYCIEPDPDNIRILRQNLFRPLKEGSLVLVEAALRGGWTGLKRSYWRFIRKKRRKSSWTDCRKKDFTGVPGIPGGQH